MMLRTHIEFSLLTSQEGRAIPKLVAEIKWEKKKTSYLKVQGGESLYLKPNDLGQVVQCPVRGNTGKQQTEHNNYALFAVN